MELQQCHGLQGQLQTFALVLNCTWYSPVKKSYCISLKSDYFPFFMVAESLINLSTSTDFAVAA